MISRETVDGVIHALTELGMHPEAKVYIEADGSIFGYTEMITNASKRLIDLYSNAANLCDAVFIEGPSEFKQAAIDEICSKGYRFHLGEMGGDGWQSYWIETPVFKFRFG